MWVLPPVLVELLPAIAAIVTAVGGWSVAVYTKAHAHDPAPAEGSENRRG